jgi:uracil-DNA glycosylase
MSAERLNRLDAIENMIRDLEESPLYDHREKNGYLPVIGEGDADARIMFVGEAPGKQEAETGLPFVGNAGRVLDRLLDSIDIAREDVYITNLVKDRPPGNRDPRPDEVDLYAPFLIQQIDRYHSACNHCNPGALRQGFHVGILRGFTAK